MEANYFTMLFWFCHASAWIRHGCTCVPHPEPLSHLPPHTIPLGWSFNASVSQCQFPLGSEVFVLVRCSVISLGLLLTQVLHRQSRSASTGFLLELDDEHGNGLHSLDSKCRTNWAAEKEDRKYASWYIIEHPRVRPWIPPGETFVQDRDVQTVPTWTQCCAGVICKVHWDGRRKC